MLYFEIKLFIFCAEVSIFYLAVDNLTVSGAVQQFMLLICTFFM